MCLRRCRMNWFTFMHLTKASHEERRKSFFFLCYLSPWRVLNNWTFSWHKLTGKQDIEFWDIQQNIVICPFKIITSTNIDHSYSRRFNLLMFVFAFYLFWSNIFGLNDIIWGCDMCISKSKLLLLWRCEKSMNGNHM